MQCSLYRRVRRLSREHRAQLARQGRTRARQDAQEDPEYQAAVRAWEARFLAARPDLGETMAALERALAQVPPGADVAQAIWGGCLTQPLGLTEAQTIISLGDGPVSEPGDAGWTPLMRAGWAAVAIQTLDGAMDAYELETGDLRPMLPQELANVQRTDPADDGETTEAGDPRERWAGIIPADVMDRLEGAPS